MLPQRRTQTTTTTTASIDGANLIKAFKAVVAVLLDCNLTQQAQQNVKKMKNYMEVLADLPLVKKSVGSVFTKHKQAVMKHVKLRDVNGLKAYFENHEDAKFLADYNEQVMSLIAELEPVDAERCWTCLDKLE